MLGFRTFTPMILACALAYSPMARTQTFEEANDSIEILTLSARNLAMSLNDEQQAKALFPMGDTEWFNVRLAPFGVKGLRFEDMTPGQITLVQTIINGGLSASGYHKAASIIALEEYMVEVEQRTRRSPEFHGMHNYSVALFGTPEPGASWAVRIHGHHLYLSFGVADGKLVSTGPSFFGAQPHEVLEGPRKGWHILRDEENQGRALYLSLDEQQQKTATLSNTMPQDVFSGNNAVITDIKSTAGVAYSEMNDTQQQLLKSIVMEHVYNIPRDLAYARLDKIERGGWDGIRFSWIGSTEKQERMYYRVEGAEFMIEYCATSLGENHIHTVWREFDGDFGRDILAEHLKSSPH